MKYDLIPQERQDYCLCSVVQAILRRNNVSFSQGDIAKNLTRSKEGFRGDDERIKSFLRANGLEYFFYWQNETPFNERDTLLEEMNVNEGIIGVNSHVYLLESFRYPRLEIINPEDNRIVTKDYFELVRIMDQEDFFAMIKRVKQTRV